MDGPIAIVTGASGGLGSQLCKMLAALPARLVLLDRDIQKSQAFAQTLNDAHPGTVIGTFAVDLADHASIRRLTTELLSRYPVVHYLFNNAGVLTETLQFSAYETELHFEVNALAPLQLVDQLRPALARANGAVVLGTSAGLSTRVKTLEWTSLIAPTSFRKLYGPYLNSKQALNVLTAALARELAADKIYLRTADPGPNRTTLTRGAGTPLWMRLFYWALPSPAKGARKLFQAAVAPKWFSRSGVFVLNDRAEPLPPALADAQFQQELLREARVRAALVAGPVQK